MQKTLRMRYLGWLCAAVGVACLSACGSSDESASALHSKPVKRGVPHAATQVADPTANMSLAVNSSKGLVHVDVKFQMQTRPEPGQSLSVDFALIPDPQVTTLSAKFEGDEGLTIVSGDQLEDVQKPAPNVPIHHTVTVLPKADGIYTITASLTVTTDTEPKVHTFSLPIIAGNGLAAHGGPESERPQ